MIKIIYKVFKISHKHKWKFHHVGGCDLSGPVCYYKCSKCGKLEIEPK